MYSKEAPLTFSLLQDNRHTYILLYMVMSKKRFFHISFAIINSVNEDVHVIKESCECVGGGVYLSVYLALVESRNTT